MNPKWFENKILEMAQDIKDLKEIMKVVSLAASPLVKETKYPINKGK
jgi:hypothetical protein